MEENVSLGHVPKEKWNYLKLAECLSLASNKLKEYTEYIISRIHIRIREKLSGQTPCKMKCSQRIVKHNIWCDTCKSWKRELLSLVRHKNKLKTINWRKIKSWKWPETPLWIVPIFLNTIYVKKVEEINLNDLATVLSIWDNCKEYRISQHILNKLRKNRNKCFAHNPKLRVSDSKVKNICCVLNTLFVELSMDILVPEHIKVQICEWQRELWEIKSRKLYEELVLEKVDIVDRNISAVLSNNENVKHIVADLDKKSDSAVAQVVEVKGLIINLDTKTELALSNEGELSEKVDKVDEKADKILSNSKKVNVLLKSVDKRGDELLGKVDSINKRLQNKTDIKENTEPKYDTIKNKNGFLTFGRLKKYLILISSVIVVTMAIIGISYLCPENVATCLTTAASNDTIEHLKNIPLRMAVLPSKKDRLSALAADYMCYHYTQKELQLIRSGIFTEALVCEQIARKVYAIGDVKCGDCTCCQFIPPEFECYDYGLVEKMQIDHMPEKDVCEAVPGRIFTQGNGVCGNCWCCKMKINPHVCYHYTTQQLYLIHLNSTLERKICESVPTRLYTEGDGTCGGCWCCQERENLSGLQEEINQIK